MMVGPRDKSSYTVAPISSFTLNYQVSVIFLFPSVNLLYYFYFGVFFLYVRCFCCIFMLYVIGLEINTLLFFLWILKNNLSIHHKAINEVGYMIEYIFLDMIFQSEGKMWFKKKIIFSLLNLQSWVVCHLTLRSFRQS